MSRQPNVLLFLTDDQRSDTLRALGNSEIYTPNLDALAARGTVFTRAHIPGGTSAAVCMPSRAMLHTGRTLFHLDQDGQEIPAAHTLLGECFQSAGYATFGTGKWHNGKDAYARSFSDGDEIMFGGMGDHWNVLAHHFDPTGRYEGRCPLVEDPFHGNAVTWRHCDHVPGGTHSTDLFTDAATAFLDRRDASQPFFMFVSLMAPHDPRSMPAQYVKLYDPDTITVPANFAPAHAIDTGALRIRDELLAGFPRDPAEIRRHLADYYAMITHLDAAFGRLVDALRAAGELDNTIIVVAGDNGLALGQHGLMGKQNLYDHSLRVPLVFAGPGIPEGARSDALVYLLDLFPTLCDLTGCAVPESVEGRSLAGCLADPSQPHREDLYLAYCDTIRGLTDGRYKWIEYACGARQLFDLGADPDEMRNLVDAPTARPVAAAMAARLRGHAAQWDDREHPLGSRFWRAIEE